MCLNGFSRGPGGDGTLPMEVLQSPNNSIYYIKFGWISEEPRTHLEHINEIIAAKIAQLLHLDTIRATLAQREGRIDCLSLDFVEQYNATMDESGASLMEMELGERYNKIQHTSLKDRHLVKAGVKMLKDFSYFEKIRTSFIAMNLFDILIGNQDRHPGNWVILFTNGDASFGPIFDNGASLGFQLPDNRLKKMLHEKNEFKRYFYRMKVKAGIYTAPRAPVKATDVLAYCIKNYPDEIKHFKTSLSRFPFAEFDKFIEVFPLYSKVRKEFLKVFVRDRRNRILRIIKEGI